MADLAHHRGTPTPPNRRTTMTNREPDVRNAVITLIAGKGQVILGGKDISNAIQGFTLRAEAGLLADLELELAAPGAVEPRVYMHEETRQALISLGWTPPAGDEDEAGAA